MLELSSTEVELLNYLSHHGPKTIEELSEALSLDQLTTSKALSTLYDYGFIISKGGHPTLFEVSKDAVDMGDGNSREAEQNSSQQSDSAFVIGAKRVFLVHHGQDVAPCFDVEDLANAFVSVIDSVASPKSDSISMLGIFGSWGRGKTYFFNIVKKNLLLHKVSGIRYDIIEFNAWKYQSVPAIWASLFETIYHYKSRIFRFWFSIKRNFLPFVRDMFICFSVPLFVWGLSFLIEPLKTWVKANNIVFWSLLVSLLAYTISLISKHQKDILAIIRKYIKGISFAEHLGVQAEIEKTLADYLKTWIHSKNTKTRKVLLYVEDVDRCERSKMIDIIESLRTILEHPEIRKRLIVIVSLDTEVFWRALQSRFKDISDEMVLHEIIVNHFDKLFTASISLPQLTKNDELAFLKAISCRTGSERISAYNYNRSLFPFEKETHSIIKGILRFFAKCIHFITFPPFDPSFLSEEEKIALSASNYSDVYQLLSQSLSKFNDLHLTPRQLSCIYYRTLLAINLISTMNKGTIDIDSLLTDQIIVRSYMFHNMNEFKNTLYEDILDIVIPYPVTNTR